MTPTGKLFSFYFTTTFVSAYAGYYALKLLIPGRDVFGSLYRMFLYHEEHPLPYIAIVALTYAGVATFSVTRWRHFTGWRRSLVILAIMAASVTIASIPGGMLWVVHDMIAGFVPSIERTISYLRWGALAGLQVGWIIVATSFPFSLVGAVLGYIVTNQGFENKNGGHSKRRWFGA
jgi:hypothetical protein